MGLLYYRFCLSYRDVEELLCVRGVTVTYEAIRKWCHKFGKQYASQLRRRRPRPGDKWHMDEVFLTIHGDRHYLWRAWIKTAMGSISWSSGGATKRLPRNSSGSSSGD